MPELHVKYLQIEKLVSGDFKSEIRCEGEKHQRTVKSNPPIAPVTPDRTIS